MGGTGEEGSSLWGKHRGQLQTGLLTSTAQAQLERKDLGLESQEQTLGVGGTMQEVGSMLLHPLQMCFFVF